MKTMYDSRFKVEVMLIGQGEYFVSDSGKIITTTLGSCIAVCLFDQESRVGGMNHYMLPEPAIEKEDIIFGKAKYGINSMEILINETLKAGAVRTRLKAKIFGGANMFHMDQQLSESLSVGQQNITFARKYLQTENIKIVSEDVGGVEARKIYFDPATAHVKLFRISSQLHQSIKNDEQKYLQSIRKEEKDVDVSKDITLF